ncbi:MAG: bifunctional riboflavin kinase/FAD synthetase [bacterium]|nr:bifunctional riboflavin kinase/FAD synthetase [bacterium]
MATIGTFDGIHVGHQEIFRSLALHAAPSKAVPLLISFHPHPRILVTPDDAPLLLTTIEEKQKFIPDFLEGDALILDFDEKLKEMTHEQFVREILVERLGVNTLVVGYDHALGKDRKGTINELCRLGKELGFSVEVVGPVLVDGQPVSSSRVRRALVEGPFEHALRLLGHEYAIYGTVERGIGLGRKLGYPTANLNYNNRKLLPPEGVYTCRVRVGDECKNGMMFIGHNHFNPERKISVEANLFDFDKDIYDWEITFYPTHFIRENEKFDSTNELKEQLKRDKITSIDIIEKEGRNADQQGAKSSNHC